MLHLTFQAVNSHDFFIIATKAILETTSSNVIYGILHGLIWAQTNLNTEFLSKILSSVYSSLANMTCLLRTNKSILLLFLSQVPLVPDSLDPRYVFIVDNGMQILIWYGLRANPLNRSKAR